MGLVERQRSGGVQRASHSGSSDQVLGSIRPSTRHHAALASCSLYCPRSTLRLSSAARPLASTTQREDSLACPPLRSNLTRYDLSPSPSSPFPPVPPRPEEPHA